MPSESKRRETLSSSPSWANIDHAPFLFSLDPLDEQKMIPSSLQILVAYRDAREVIQDKNKATDQNWKSKRIETVVEEPSVLTAVAGKTASDG